MKILAVDDEMMALKNMEFKLKEVVPNAEFYPMEDCKEAIQWAGTEHPDVMFLDINMGEMNGIELAKHMREVSPQSAIIFLTGYTEYAVEAFAMKVNGYLMKPVDADDLRRELELIKDISKSVVPVENKLVVHCFGNFEVFWNGEAVAFARTKSKELFAYLIDRRGSSVTMAEIASVLWADGMFDHSRNNQIHSFLHDLTKSLEGVGAKNIINKKRNSISVNEMEMDCDYFSFLRGDVAAINAYNGEYMSQYWWAEFTAGEIYSMITER